MLLVVLASLTRVETGVARNTQDLARARQNALVGLHVALGRLQAVAGPDQRVTATADLIGATNNRWTGVWDTTSMADGPVWLVSGGTPDPNSAASGEILVGANTTGPVTAVVRAATEDIVVDSFPGLAGPQTVGRFAWWVGDEGVKGRLDIRDTVDLVPVTAAPGDPVTTLAGRDRLRQLFQHRSGGDALPTLALADEDTAASRWNGLTNVISYNQLKFLYATNTAQRNFLRDNFHDFTVFSEGLLASTAGGGLKSNLGDPASPLAFPAIADLDAFRPGAGDTLSVFTGTAVGTSAAPVPTAQVKPLVTEFALDVVLYREEAPGAAQARLFMGYRVRAEFLNPYLLAIEHNPAGQSDYLVRFTGLPAVTVIAPLQSVATVGDVDLGSFLGPATSVPVDFDANLLPGQTVRRVSGRVQALDTGRPVIDFTPTDPTDNRLNLRGPSSTVTVGFFAASDPARPIAVFSTVPFGAFEVDRDVNWEIAGNEPFPNNIETGHVVGHGISFHLRADPSRATWGDWVNPASGPSPPDLRATWIPYDPVFWESAGADPADSAEQAGVQFNAADPVFAFNKTLVAFDFTTQRHLSVAGLGMVAFPGSRPLSVGSPWGGALNAWFDAAFFNPVPSTWAAGRPLPNTRHRVIGAPFTGAQPSAADLAGADAAQFLTVAGAFNVNSTSTNAWTALLGRTVRQWEDRNGAPKRLVNPFFTLGHSAQFGDPAVAGFPILGRRTLTDALVQNLAGQLRTRIRARGAPFASMQDFVNSGVLQQSIDAAGLNAAGAGVADLGGAAPAPFTPNHLTQAAVLGTLAPVLAARSDTFTIRAFGSVINPATGAENGRAWCEAVVQRVPEFAAAAGTGSVMGNPGGLGRRFKIVRFRWLTRDDI